MPDGCYLFHRYILTVVREMEPNKGKMQQRHILKIKK